MRTHSLYNQAFDNLINFADPDGIWPFPWAYVGNTPSWMREAGFAMANPKTASEIGSFKKGSDNLSTRVVRFSTREENSESDPILKTTISFNGRDETEGI